MKKRAVFFAVVLVICLAAGTALAANVFSFTEKSVTLFEGESVQAALRREGQFEDDGEIAFASGKDRIATVSGDGTITGISKGQTDVTATFRRNGKRVGNPARITVKVLRAVSRITLNTGKLNVYNPDDPAAVKLLREETEHQVLVIAAGTTVTLSATCTPEDASNRQVTWSTSDAGVAKITGNSLKAVQRGECDIIASSVLNPEVTETVRVVVIQPVKKIQIRAGDKTVAAGFTLQLSAACLPENASITDVVWESKNPGIAAVDENGVVTGVKRGTAHITATAADGSKAVGSVTVSVTQPVEDITFTQREYLVNTGRSVQAKVTVGPANANDKGVFWSSSDETIATVRGGQITGQKAGTCEIICTSKSNPEVSATAIVTVSQLVTKITNENDPAELALRVGETAQLLWSVLPDDATHKGLTFRSLAPKVATVDANGVVTAVGRGVAAITATAQDGSRKQGNTKVTVIQPVTGVNIQRDLYYVQHGGAANVRAVVQPKNANNQRVTWLSEDESIVTVRSNGTSTGLVSGINPGTAVICTYTEDGGFTASARVRVGDFNGAVMTESLEVNANNEIRIVLRNMSREIIMENVHYRIECFDIEGNPMICSADGENVFFEGDYPYILNPYERTAHGGFRFRNSQIDQPIGMVVLTVLSWTDADGYTWTIPDDDQVRTEWTRYSNYNYYENQDQGVG